MSVKKIRVNKQKHKQRICAYIRVSTTNGSQLESLENQKQYFENLYSNRDDIINILKFCVMIARIANNGEALRYSSPNKLDSMIFIKKFEKQVTEVFVTFCQKVTFL